MIRIHPKRKSPGGAKQLSPGWKPWDQDSPQKIEPRRGDTPTQNAIYQTVVSPLRGLDIYNHLTPGFRCAPPWAMYVPPVPGFSQPLKPEFRCASPLTSFTAHPGFFHNSTTWCRACAAGSASGCYNTIGIVCYVHHHLMLSHPR